MEAKSDKIQTSGDSTTASNNAGPIPPMSAYDIFIRMERKAFTGSSSDMLETEASFATHVSAKWQNIDDALKMEIEELAKLEEERYNREIEEWKMSTEAQDPKTPQITVGQMSHCEKPPAKKVKSLSKTSHSGIAFPPLPVMAAPGPRRIIRRDTQSSLLHKTF